MTCIAHGTGRAGQSLSEDKQYGIGIELALSSIERGGRYWARNGLRGQPVRSACYRAQKPPRGTSPLLWPVSAPRTVSKSLMGRVTMRNAHAIQNESNEHIISSIINLVCPQCGGRMLKFQCDGRCRRNWLAEWEWANQATLSSKSRLHGHAAGSIR